MAQRRVVYKTYVGSALEQVAPQRLPDSVRMQAMALDVTRDTYHAYLNDHLFPLLRRGLPDGHSIVISNSDRYICEQLLLQCLSRGSQFILTDECPFCFVAKADSEDNVPSLRQLLKDSPVMVLQHVR